MTQTSLVSLDKTEARRQMVDELVRKHGIIVAAPRRQWLRALDYITTHKQLNDEFGQFRALVTDGHIAYCKLADGRIVEIVLANLCKPLSDSGGLPRRVAKCEALSKAPQEKKQTQTTIRALEMLKDLGIDLTDKQQEILNNAKRNHS